MFVWDRMDLVADFVLRGVAPRSLKAFGRNQNLGWEMQLRCVGTKPEVWSLATNTATTSDIKLIVYRDHFD